MQVVMVLFRADGERRSFSISRDVTIIGRREDCDLRIPLGDVSRKHCRLIREENTLRVEDFGSSNGTYHNGQRVQEAVLQPGDSVQVGPVVFVVQIDSLPPDEDLQPVVCAAAMQPLPANAPSASQPAPIYDSPPPPPPTTDDGLVILPDEHEQGAIPTGLDHVQGDDAGFDIILDDPNE